MTRKLREASEGRKVDFGARLPVWIDFNKGPYSLIPFNEREDTLRLMVKLAMAGSPLFRISRELNGRGIGFRVACDRGHRLNMLHNTKLIGDLHLCEHHFPGYFPPLLTLPEWDALQAKLMACSIKNGKRGGQTRRKGMGPVPCHDYLRCLREARGDEKHPWRQHKPYSSSLAACLLSIAPAAWTSQPSESRRFR